MIACSLLAGAILQGIGTRVTETADAGSVALDEAPAVDPEPYALAGGK